MATNGMLAAGYNIITIDVGYASNRVDGVLMEDTNRFPFGVKSLADYVHSLGFKFGIYGTGTISNHVDPIETNVDLGSYGFETNDANLWASWGADYLKYDYVSLLGTPAVFSNMEAALAQCGRPIIYMLSGGYFDPYKPIIANQWRVGEDIWMTWEYVMHNLDQVDLSAKYAGPGQWNDPDMLEVGTSYPSDWPGLTDEENKSHFSLWCMVAAPLIAGLDVRKAPQKYIDILTAPEIIAVDQDPHGIQGTRVQTMAATGGNLEVWSKPVGSNLTSRAVALFNRSDIATNMTVYWTNLSVRLGPATVSDLWARADLGVFTNSFSATVPSHGTVMLNVTPLVSVFDTPSLRSYVSPTNTLVFAWPAPSFGFVLRQSSTLASASWPDFPTPPTQVGSEMELVIPSPPANSFFRLHFR
jgi:alpha-galactosidase